MEKVGVAILVRNGIPSQEIIFSNQCNQLLEICGVNLTVDNEVISVLSVYRPPRVLVSINEYIEIFNSSEKKCIIGGDFNAHHTSWDSENNDTQGTVLSAALDELINNEK